MRCYLASRYSRRLELCQYRTELQACGHVVTSHWLDGDDSEFESSGSPLPVEIAQKHALRDLANIASAELFLAFTEPPDSPYSRGGRHIEAGYAIAARKRLIVIGPFENIFYTLPGVQHYATWPLYLHALMAAP